MCKYFHWHDVHETKSCISGGFKPMQGKLKEQFPFIYTEEIFMIYEDSEIISIKYVKDMES